MAMINKMLREVVVLCVLLAVASAFVERHHLEPKPDKFKDQPGCYVKEFDTVLDFGKKMPSKERCVEYTCSEDEVAVFGCVVIGVGPKCKIVEDTTLPFPDCCPKEKCKN